jgi:hypothetical protein
MTTPVDNCNIAENKTQCENDIFAAFNALNTSFRTYDDAYLCFTKSSAAKNCPTPAPTEEILTAAATNLETKINALDILIRNYNSTFVKSDGTKKGTAGTDEFYSNLMKKYKDLTDKRAKLDEKLFELYADENDSLYSIKPQVDSAVITGVLWTALATTMIYFVFLG